MEVSLGGEKARQDQGELVHWGGGLSGGGGMGLKAKNSPWFPREIEPCDLAELRAMPNLTKLPPLPPPIYLNLVPGTSECQ